MLTKDELPECPVATTVQLIGSIAVNYLKPRTTDSGMTQWKNTGFWYIKPIIDMMKKYR